MRNKNNNRGKWKSAFEQEFGVHFKNSPDELKFALSFIEDLLKEQKQELLEIIGGIDLTAKEGDLRTIKNKSGEFGMGYGQIWMLNKIKQTLTKQL
jgi:hypothetical protein